MNINDWYEAGDQIKDLVQDAIDRQDFSQLSNTISGVVNQTVDGLQSVLKDSLGQNRRSGEWKDAQGRDWESGPGEDARDWYSNEKRAYRERDQQSGAGASFGDQHRYSGEGNSSRGRDARSGREKTWRYQDTVQQTRSEAAEQIRRRMEEKQKEKQKTYHPVRRRLKVPGEFSGRVMAGVGYSFGGMFGLSLAILGVIGITTGAMVIPPMGILGVLFAFSMCLGARGSSRLGLAKRFRRYTELLGERTFCLVEELASGVGESCKYVRKDLRKMIRRGFFPQGHLDVKETCLITDNSTYQQYLTTQQAYVSRELSAENKKAEKKEQREEQKREKQKETQEETQETQQQPSSEKLSPECRELIGEGKTYIRHIHDCNDRIADVAMSEKLDRLETVTTRIFTEAEKDPEVVGELKKMMSYYLPTTKKLLDAYCELDDQPVQGPNILTTKKEIEEALDTINEAFTNLLDSLFEETAWDISSDISVLHTMLAQEGLTKKDFVRADGSTENIAPEKRAN